MEDAPLLSLNTTNLNNVGYGQGTTLYDAPVYGHESLFRSKYVTVSVRCPDAWVYDEDTEPLDIPVFGPNDLVGGTVSLNPELSSNGTGRLSISVEGSFVFISPNLPQPEGSDLPPPLKHEHTFFSGSMAIATYPPEPARPTPKQNTKGRWRGPRSHHSHAPSHSLHDVFGFSLTTTLRTMFERRSRNNEPMEEPVPRHSTKEEFMFHKSKSTSLIPSSSQPVLVEYPDSPASESWQMHSFSFPLPANSGTQSMPPSFASSHLVELSGIRGRAYAENAEVSYRIIVTWESLVNERKETLEAPFLYQPVQDDVPSMPPTHSRAASTAAGGHKSFTDRASSQWADFGLYPDLSSRPPFRGILTLPHPCSFPRTSTIPYYIFFVTNPMYRFLAKDIRRESTVIVSLVRVITMDGTRGAVEAPTPSPSPGKRSVASRNNQQKGEVQEAANRSLSPPAIAINEDSPSRKRADSLNPTRTLLQRVTTPILGRRRQALSARLPNPYSPVTPTKPKYLPADKQLPVLPQGSVIVDTRIVATDVVVGFQQHPDDKRAEKEKDKRERARELEREREREKKKERERRKVAASEDEKDRRMKSRSKSKSQTRRKERRRDEDVDSVVEKAERLLNGTDGMHRDRQRNGGREIERLDEGDSPREIDEATQRQEGGPEGLIHGKLKLNRDMLISIKWVGLSVEYFFDIEVRYGSDVLTSRAPVIINSDAL